MTASGGSRIRSFVLGGIVGGVAAFAAGRLKEKRQAARSAPPGLSAFEDAPCYREAREREPPPRNEI